MLTFYFSPGSSSMATHIALHEVGVPFEAKLTALHEQKNRAPDYLAVNPEGKVPTLMIDGWPLTEVAATLWYLARRYPEAGLLPQYGDGEGEAGEATALHRLEDVDRADDVDQRPARRIGGGERHEHRRQMDHVRDRALVERVLDGREVGDVAAHELDAGQLLGAHHQLGAPAVFTEVEGHDRAAFAHELAAAPRADAAERAGEEPALVRHPGRP